MLRCKMRPFERGHGKEKEGDAGTPDLSRIGAILRDEREGRRVSLASAARALFIKKSSLDAIESGRWAMLPHPVYVKGYIKLYASYLGVPEKIAHELRQTETMPDEQNIGGAPILDRTIGRDSLKKAFLACASALTFVLGFLLSPALLPAPAPRPENLLAACHAMLIAMRRSFML